MKLVNWITGLVLIVCTVGIFSYMSTKPAFTTRYKLITLPGGTFDLDVQVLITDDTAFAADYVRKNMDVVVTADMFDTRGTTFGSVDGKPPIIWLPQHPHVSIINHELLHATISVMNWAGVPLTDSTEEVYAYELQYLSQQLDNQLNTIK